MFGHDHEDLEEPRSLKVSISTGVYLKLHRLKILEGVNLSETVETALIRYLQGRDELEPGEGDPS